MTTVLNRKFDLLCHSGTCPSYLVDVLSLLVAHANDTELFKSELRTTAGSSGAALAPAGRGPSHSHPRSSTRDAAELSAGERRTQLMYRQVEDPEALDDALRASHESVLIAAEQSLQTYAEDLKHMNGIAMATSAKQLRAMRVETQQQMEAFRDRVCAGVVSQTQEELEVLRSELGAAVKADAGALVGELHDVSVAAQHQVTALTSSFAAFVAQTHEATVVAPLEDAHEARAAVYLVEERLDSVAAAAAARADVDALEARLRELERVVAALGSAVSGPHTEVGEEKPTPQEAMRPVTAAHAGEASRGHSHRSASDPPTTKPSTLLPSQGKTGQRGVAAPSSSTQRTAAPSPSPPPPPPPPVVRSCAERLGVTVEAAEEGVVLGSVTADSPAAQYQLGAGHIISHVGRVAVTTPAAFESALEAVEGQPLKLTTYDPFQGRIRVLTIPSL